MTSTTDRPVETLGPDQKNRGGRRWGVVALVVGVFVLIVAGVVWIGATREDDPSALPAEVQQAVDDFVAAGEAGDYDALEAIVTDALRRPSYLADAQGGPAVRRVMDLDGFYSEYFGSDRYEIETVGDPVIVGDGPWFVALPQVWVQEGTGAYRDVLYTLTIVEEDGVLRVDDGHWMAVGSYLIAGRPSNDLVSNELPIEVADVVDGFVRSIEENDFESMTALLTDDFSRPEYFADPSGGTPFRAVQDHDDFRRLLGQGVEYDVEALGDPVVVGDGPWFVALPQRWVQPASDMYYDAVYSLVIVDEDGALLIDEGYWAGAGPFLIAD